MTTNSFQGTNSFARPTDAGNIQASQIQDLGLRNLLQDQFKPINSFTNRPAVAPLSQLQSVADQYQGIDRSQMDDATWNFMQPYLSGQMSSINPTQAFIHRDQLKAAQEAMNARNQQIQTSPQYQHDEAFKKLYGQLDPTRYRVKDEATTRGYYDRGFIPGQDNGDWKWVNGAGPQAMLLELAFANQNSGAVDSDGIPFIRNQEELAADKWRQDYLSTVSPEGSGTWYNDKDPMHGIDYRPGQGYSYTEYDSAPKGFNKYMPALTMAALGAMTGGAAAAAMAPAGAAAGTGLGLGGSAVAGAASAIPSAMYTGLNTGDWGKALTGVGLGALGGAAGSVIGPGINGALGIGKDSLLSGLGSGISRAGMSAIGDLARGKGVNWQNALTTLGSALGTGAMGSLANEYLPKDIGGSTLAASALRNVGTGAISGGLNALLKGSSKDILNAAMSGALGGAINSGSAALGGGTIGNAVGNSVLNAYLAAAKRKKASEQG